MKQKIKRGSAAVLAALILATAAATATTAFAETPDPVAVDQTVGVTEIKGEQDASPATNAIPADQTDDSLDDGANDLTNAGDDTNDPLDETTLPEENNPATPAGDDTSADVPDLPDEAGASTADDTLPKAALQRTAASPMAAGDVVIDETTFPDEAFRNYVMANFDGDKSGSLSAAEIASITGIVCDGQGFTDLTGIEYFTELALLKLGDSPVKELDLSNNKKLFDVRLSGSSTLTTLTGLENCTTLQEIELGAGSVLTELNLSGCTALQSAPSTFGTELKSLNLAGCTGLTAIWMSNTELKSLNLAGCTGLTSITMNNTELESINIENCVNLEKLYALRSKLTSVQLENNVPNLTHLMLDINQLEEIDVSGCSNLQVLTASTNNLRTVDVSQNPKLFLLSVGSNPLEKINFGNNKIPSEFYMELTSITDMDLSGVDNFKALSVLGSKLMSLDLSGLTTAISVNGVDAIPSFRFYFSGGDNCQIFQARTLLVENDSVSFNLTDYDAKITEGTVNNIKNLQFLDMEGNPLNGITLNGTVVTGYPKNTAFQMVYDWDTNYQHDTLYMPVRLTIERPIEIHYKNVDGTDFTNWGANYQPPITYIKGTGTTLPNGGNVEKPGYTFGGWYENADLTGEAVTEIGTTEETVKTYYAKWIANVVPPVTPTQYTVTFVDWDGTVLKTETVTSGGSATAPTEPTREGYTFTGWDAAFDNVTGSLTVTAQYTQNQKPPVDPTPVQHKVTFVDWDGKELKTELVNDGDSATPPAAPIREGYTFTGWDIAFDNVTGSLTVTAQYTQNQKPPVDPTPAQHKVTFVDWDGKELKTELVNDGDSATPPAAPTREGYTFTGWDAAFDNVTGSLTVTAQYTQNQKPASSEPVSAGESYTAGGEQSGAVSTGDTSTLVPVLSVAGIAGVAGIVSGILLKIKKRK